MHNPNFDMATGLPNQHFFSEKLKECIATHPESNHAVYQLEVVEYKEIVVALGQAFADAFLSEFSSRLEHVIPAGALLARVGPNQFMILISQLTDVSSLSNVANKILNLMLSSTHVMDEDIFVHGYVGVSYYPEDGKTEILLMRNAGLALDAAKLSDPNSFSFYDKSLNDAIDSRRKLLKEFRIAVDEDQFEIYYQPQISFSTYQLTGAEALIRWPHPNQGMIPPAEFVPVIEQNGSIVALGYWILKMACAQVHMWKNAKLPIVPRVAINLSGMQFRDKDFVDILTQVVASSHIEPSMIELEITENVMNNNIEQTIKKIKQLSELGFMIAIDDFGTGYSSLSCLGMLPINKLKIDQSFVHDLATSHEAKNIVHCIIALAKSLNLTTVAEGVETEEQFEFLKAAGCDEGQGYLFSQPIPASQFEEAFLLKQGKDR